MVTTGLVFIINIDYFHNFFQVIICNNNVIFYNSPASVTEYILHSPQLIKP